MSEPIKFCPTCGHTLPDYPFKVGDKVRHMSGYEGVVERIGKVVEVQYEKMRGEYDRGWFEAWPNGLTRIQ